MGPVKGEALKTSFKCLGAKVPVRLKDMSCCNTEVFTSASHQVLQAMKIWKFVSAAALVDHYITDTFPTSTLAAAQTCHLGKDKKKPWKSSMLCSDNKRSVWKPNSWWSHESQCKPSGRKDTTFPPMFLSFPQWKVLCRLMNAEFLQTSRWWKGTKWSRLLR